MKQIMRCIFIFIILISCLCLTLETLMAQESNETEGSSSTGSVLSEPAPTVDLKEARSDTERIISLQETIDSEEESLAKLETELEDRQTTFDEVSNSLKNLSSQRKEKEVELQQLKEQGKDYDSEGLEGEIDKLEETEGLVKKRSALALELLRTAQQQISTLKEKIRTDRDALDKLKGIKMVEGLYPAATPAPAEPLSDVVVQVAPPVPPGLITQPADKQALPEEASREKPLTKEQITARKEAERKVADALIAERTIAEYEERKRILEKQITLAESQRKTVRDTYDNFEKTLSLRQQELEEKIAAGKPQSELLRIQQDIRSIYGEADKVEDEIRKRNERINELHGQYETLLEDKLERVLEAERKRSDAEIARKKSVWLESPFHPQNLLRWATTHIPQILLTILGLILIRFFAHLLAENLTRLMTKRGGGTSYERENRAKTLSEAFKDTASLVIYVGGTLLILESAGVSIKTLLGGAAVLGLAVAFGAQNLMRDYFYGFMILLEGQYKLNDVITIGDATGVVEHMTMRMTVLRDLEGRAHFIPNGQIARVINRTHEWSRAVLEIRVSYREDVDRVMGILLQLAKELQHDPEFSSSVIEEPQMLGVDKLDESAIVIKFMLKTQPTKMWPVRRELLRRIKNKFDELGILIPAPYRIRLEQDDDKS